VNNIFKRCVFIIVMFIAVPLSGCGGSGVKITQTDIGSKTLSSFDEMAASKDYGRWNYRESYGYKVVGWNKFGSQPYYAVFDKNDLLVEFLGTDVAINRPASLMELDIKDIDLDKIHTIKLAKEKERQRKLQTEQEILAALDKTLAKVDGPYICTNERQCKKAFTLTQIYISENAEMKIQIATDTIIETYGSSKKVTMKATRMPGKGSNESIYLQAIVPYSSFYVRAKQKKVDLMRGYHNFLKSRI